MLCYCCRELSFGICCRRMLQLTKFCTDLKRPQAEKSKWEHLVQKIFSLTQEFPGKNIFWRLVEHPGEALLCFAHVSALAHCSPSGLNLFAWSSPWRFSGSIFDLEKPKMLGNWPLKRFACPVESIDADCRLVASCKEKEVTCIIPWKACRFRNFLFLYSYIKYIYLDILLFSFVLQYKIFS